MIPKIPARFFLAFLVITGGAPAAKAKPNFLTSSVRTESMACTNNNAPLPSELLGSGLPFQINGKAYVVSSASRFYQGVPGSTSSTYCHFVTGNGLARARAELLVSDWGHDLALLRLPDVTPDAEWPSLDDLAGDTGEISDPIQLAGFPSNNGNTFDTESGILFLPSSDRGQIPLLDNYAEVQGAKAESAMVGGPVVILSTGKLIGIISREYLKITPGSSTLPYEWDAVPGHWENQLIVLPSSDIHQWVENYFTSNNSVADFFVDPTDVQKNDSKVTSGSVSFEMACPPASSPGSGGTGPIGGGDPVGIGGGDPVGIGGGDPVGIGGRNSGATGCAVKLSSSGAVSTPWPYPDRQVWLDEMTRQLHSGKSLYLGFLVSRSPRGTLSRTPIRLLSSLFHQLRDDDFTPVLFWARGLNESLSDPTQSFLFEASRKAQPLAVDCYATFSDPDMQLMVRSIYLQLQLLTSEQWAMVKKSDLEPLIDLKGVYGPAWSSLISLPICPAQDLLNRLKDIDAHLPAEAP